MVSNKTISLLDLPPSNRREEVDQRYKQFPTTSNEYGWFYDKKDALWQFYPWTQMPNIMHSPAYYKSVYGSKDSKPNAGPHNGPAGVSSSEAPNSSRTARYYHPTSGPGNQPRDRPSGSQTERAPAKSYDPYSKSMTTYRAHYKQHGSGSDSLPPNFIGVKSIELTTKDDKKLRFDLCDHSQPQPQSQPPSTSRI